MRDFDVVYGRQLSPRPNQPWAELWGCFGDEARRLVLGHPFKVRAPDQAVGADADYLKRMYAQGFLREITRDAMAPKNHKLMKLWFGFDAPRGPLDVMAVRQGSRPDLTCFGMVRHNVPFGGKGGGAIT